MDGDDSGSDLTSLSATPPRRSRVVELHTPVNKYDATENSDDFDDEEFEEIEVDEMTGRRVKKESLRVGYTVAMPSQELVKMLLLT